MSTGEGIGYPLQYFGASQVALVVKHPPADAGDEEMHSLVAQLVKNLSTMQEILVQFLG